LIYGRSRFYYYRLNPAVEVVLWAARRALGRNEDLAPIAGRVRDWREVVECASQNAVIPLVARALIDKPLVPFEIRRELDKRYTVRAGHNAFLAREQFEILSEFQRAGIEALAYKGPVLAILAYGELALRHPSSDIDVLLHRSDLDRARRIVLARGYEVTPGPDEEEHILRYKYHLHCERRDPELHIELHWALTPAYWKFPLDYWKNIHEVSLGFCRVPSLSPESTLLAICAHGAKEGWWKLGQAVDLAQFIQAQPDLDWTWILAEARRIRRERVLRLGLLLVSRIFGVAVPAFVADDAASDREAIALARERGAQIGVGYFGGAFRAYGLRLWHHPIDRLRYLTYILRLAPNRFRELTEPTDEDRKILNLKGPFAVFYIVFRPARLIVQRGFGHVFQQAIRSFWWRPP
jgi:hypothetical protein